MTADSELTRDGRTVAGHTSATGEAPRPVPRTTLIWYSILATLLFGWFLFGWLVLQQGFVDSAGEALGTGFTLLLVVSIVGSVRRDRG